MPSPFPSLPASIAAGARAVGGSPVVLATAFLSLLLSWAVFSLLGAEPTPHDLSVLLSVLPVPVVFSDAGLAIPGGESLVATVGRVAALAALRGVTFAAISILILQMLRDGRTSPAAAARALPKMTLVVAGVYVLQFGLVAAGYQIAIGLLPPFAVLIVLAGLYFLVFGPIAAAAEGDAPAQALRRGARAARLPGTRHLALVSVYFLVIVYAFANAPFAVIGPVTPSLAAWAYGLALTFVHVSVLAAFAYRWLAVRDEVPAQAPPRR